MSVANPRRNLIPPSIVRASIGYPGVASCPAEPVELSMEGRKFYSILALSRRDQECKMTEWRDNSQKRKEMEGDLKE